MVGAEAPALGFARRIGIDTTDSFVTTSFGQDTLVIERGWNEVVDLATLTVSRRDLLWTVIAAIR